MKQVLQSLKTGDTEIADLPLPRAGSNQILIKTATSLISAGTERMLVNFGKSSLLAKAKSQPDKVKQVINKIKTDGLSTTIDAVNAKLDEPLPLGYCNSGTIAQLPNEKSHIPNLEIGDRIVSNGPHAEYVTVPHTLCAKIPYNVTDEEANFTVLASIGLQGIRLAGPEIGEKFVVYGLGLIGLLTIQMLRANGCQVLGIDINKDRIALAEQFGAETVNPTMDDPVKAVNSWSNDRGADGVLITASAKTNDIVHQSAEMCRKRGRIVLVGVVGLELQRADFYQKEITFQVSSAYGPGRYDINYEEKGQDFPYGYVRWTAQRNFEAVLGMLANKTLKVDKLITHRFDFSDALSAYDVLGNDKNALGIILNYPHDVVLDDTITVNNVSSEKRAGNANIAVIGAGNFSKMTMMPAIAKTDAQISYIADLQGNAAHHLAKKFGSEKATTDYEKILKDDKVNSVFIATGHSVHAKMIAEVLDAGKHAFVEKPLAMNVDELKDILVVVEKNKDLHLMVGYNRRFSPHIKKAKSLLQGRSEALAMNMVVNAGHIPSDHWVHDPVRGGGRIIGEACHFIDLMVFLTGSLVKTVSAHMFKQGAAVTEDKMTISLTFEDGSIGTVNYFANGNKSYPKEELRIFSDERILKLDNFRLLKGFGFKGFKKMSTRRLDKGHSNEFAEFIDRMKTGGEWLIPFSELVNVSLASFAAISSAKEERTININKEYADIV